MPMKINGLYLQDRFPDVTLAGCIEIYENAITNPSEIINALENECKDYDSGVYWEKASTTGSGQYQDIRTNKVLPLTHLSELTGNKTLLDVHNIFYTLLLSSTNSYAKRFDIYEPFFHDYYSVLKYSGGEEYKAHYDGGTQIGRSISAICYLNNDYDGGEIEFVNFKIKIKPQPGMLILFPSNYAYRHIAHPVTSGTKYAIVTWIKDRQV
jgi:predicted 2-oxoglutarate/Fe(II)-dependent dioxygenase YbiX